MCDGDGAVPVFPITELIRPGVAASGVASITAATAASGVAASITTGVTAATAASGVAASITT
ncbi:MAG: hypothetical protein IJR99_03800, partial [Kiritimatiellae bacterium]|nr:hypothetical protein [Kiritimatiellia bacterium]